MIKGSSEDITADEIAEQVGPVRFFSVDGGHWKSIVQNDLRIAAAALSADGVIALDDYCRADWPDVTLGYALWQHNTDSNIVPFAVGSNKLYLCRRNYAEEYRAALNTPFLRNFFSKSYLSDVAIVDSYRLEPVGQDEERKIKAVLLSFGIFRPDIFIILNNWLRRIRKVTVR